jgi:hypothetical protein
MVRTSCKQQDGAVPQRWIGAGATMMAMIPVGLLLASSLISAQAELYSAQGRATSRRLLCPHELPVRIPTGDWFGSYEPSSLLSLRDGIRHDWVPGTQFGPLRSTTQSDRSRSLREMGE